MYRSTTAGIFSFVVLIFAAPVAAQGVRAQLGIGGSLTFPTSFYHADPFGDGFTPALYGLMVVDLKLPNSPIGFRLDASTGHNPANDSLKAHLSAAVGMPADAKTTLVGVNASVTYNLQPASIGRGYLMAGLGLHHLTLTETANGVSVDTSTTKFAWNVGVGLTVGAGAVSGFIEARYVDISAFEGLKPTYFATTTGIRLRIGGS